MDVSDAPASQGVMLAFLPNSTEWTTVDLPHMTLVYAGTIDTLQPGDFNSLAKDAAMLALLTRPFALSVVGLEVFGDTDKVDVLRLRQTPELQAARRTVEKWNASQHPFSPHVTLGPATGYKDPRDYPRLIGFNRIMVGWGEEQLTFNLNGGSMY